MVGISTTRKSPLSGIWRVPLAGGDESEVVKGPVGWEDWALGRRGLYYATVRHLVVSPPAGVHDPVPGLQLRPYDAALSKDAGTTTHRSLTVSPDEKWILFGEAPGWQSELMLMENFR